MGADIADTTEGGKVHVHKMARFGVETSTSAIGTIPAGQPYIDVSSYYKGYNVSGTSPSQVVNYTQEICKDAPFWVMNVNTDNSLTGDYIEKGLITFVDTSTTAAVGKQYITFTKRTGADDYPVSAGETLHLDFYVIRPTADVTEIQVRKDKFAGYFYVEAETLYRRQDSGADLPAVITIPKVKIQSNFSFSMSADGDPSTFSFVMDAFPDKTYFDQTKEVLVVIQIVDDDDKADEEIKTVMPHKDDEVITYNSEGTTYGYSDSYIGTGDGDEGSQANAGKYKYDRTSNPDYNPSV